MTVGTVRTQGTELFFVDNSVTTSDPDLIKLACPTGIQGLGGAKDQIETTCLDTVGDKEFAGGLGNPGVVTVPFNLIPREYSHQNLLALKKAGEITLGTRLRALSGIPRQAQAAHWLYGPGESFLLPRGQEETPVGKYEADLTVTTSREGKLEPRIYRLRPLGEKLANGGAK